MQGECRRIHGSRLPRRSGGHARNRMPPRCDSRRLSHVFARPIEHRAQHRGCERPVPAKVRSRSKLITDRSLCEFVQMGGHLVTSRPFHRRFTQHAGWPRPALSKAPHPVRRELPQKILRAPATRGRNKDPDGGPSSDAAPGYLRLHHPIVPSAGNDCAQGPERASRMGRERAPQAAGAGICANKKAGL